MNKFLFAFLLIPAALSAAEIPGIPRDSNIGNTGGYDGTRVEAQLVVDVKEQTKVIHFIRDNNDPRVVTKTYRIKHVDAYEIRDFLRQMVQSKRVGNTSLQQVYPGNADSAATASAPGITVPVNAQETYNPAPQLGSNTAVECLKYVDGTGLLIVSAEEYRFKNHENGMGFDELIAFLDKPRMGESFGTQTYFYIPKYVPARNLKPLIENAGMNLSDVTELWQGMDLVAYDPDLNWLVFDVTNYSMANINKMLTEYDIPVPQVKLKITVYEVYRENDQKMGLDFQAWKNNGGIDFFSGGGRFRDNWSAAYGGGQMQTGSERTGFFNFNPKWNTRYIDFLVSTGRARITHTGELVVRNNTPARLNRMTQIFYMDSSEPAPDTTPADVLNPVGAYKMLSRLLQETVLAGADDYPVAKDNTVITRKTAGFGFTMDVKNASVTQFETRFTVSLANSSLIGFTSAGVPRISSGSTVALDISLPHGMDRFVIGGLRKQTSVTSKNGIPYLVDIPYLGYLFGTESTSVKTADLIVVGECIRESQEEDKTKHGSSKNRKKG